MKAKKSIVVVCAVSLAGLVAVALSGCEWFSFRSKNKPGSISDSLGYVSDTGAWLDSPTDTNRENDYLSYESAYKAYQDAKENGTLKEGETFLDYLQAKGDDSAALTSPLRTTVALATSQARGSGVIYSLHASEETEGGKTAYIITNYHVVDEDSGISNRIYAFLYGDKYVSNHLTSDGAMEATYIGGSREQDIAVLSVEVPAEKADFVLSLSAGGRTRDSDYVNVGEKVYAVGNLLGEGISVVSGIVSVEAEYNKIGDYDMLSMRIDAPITHGNSGGGLFDKNGKFLGITNGGRETYKNGDDVIDVDNYGFAIPANRALAVAQSIVDNNAGEGADGKQAAYYGLLGTFEVESSRGVFDPDTQTIDIIETVVVSDVDADSPFAGKDIKGKTLTGILVEHSDGTKISCGIKREHQIMSYLFNVRRGDKVTLIFTDGEKTATFDSVSHFGQTG